MLLHTIVCGIDDDGDDDDDDDDGSERWSRYISGQTELWLG